MSMSKVANREVDRELTTAADEARLDEEYRASPHPARWARRERFETARYERSVRENKLIFDTVGMALTCAAIFGAGRFVHLSAPLDTFCERDSLMAQPVYALAVFLAFPSTQSVYRMLRVASASGKQAHRTHYVFRRAPGKQFAPTGISIASIVVVAGLAGTMYAAAEQISSRVPPPSLHRSAAVV
jgi:hypothetical protein